MKKAGRLEARKRLALKAQAAPQDAAEGGADAFDASRRRSSSPPKAKKMSLAKTAMARVSSEKNMQGGDAGFDHLEVECEVDRFNLCNELLEQARL
ncbi:unnamed protein product, partial [Prorocentrum cordatum]